MTIRKLEGMVILVVEDEFMLADDMARCFSDAGAQIVGPAPSLALATQLAAGSRLDAAVLDVNLRGTPVYPLADALRARGVPVVLATGYATDAIPPAYADLPHCEKPVTPEAVCDAVAKAGAWRAAAAAPARG